MLKTLFHKLLSWSHTCPCQEDLFDFVLDGLPSKLQGRVRKHLAECESCRDQVKDFAWVSEGIALSADQVEPPHGLCDKVKKRIRQEP
ncbi:MAG: zf-HC2 domain-containing protein [candidate division FCPU426 bacterium]